MTDGMVSWNDYEGIEGFGAASQNDVDSLNKALTAGSAINNPGISSGEGFALRVESLEKTLRVTTFSMKHITLWKQITKIPAYNVIEEHNELLEYGANPDAGFVAEGALPEEDDSKYARRYAQVKFIGTTRKVSHVMSLMRSNQNVIAQEVINGTMHILRVTERGLFSARSDLSAVQFDGYEKLIEDNSPAANIIDLRGRPLSEDILTDAALTISDAPNYGTPTALFTNPKVKADLVKTFFPKERYDLFGKPSNGMVGLDIKGFTSPAGDVTFESDVFITDGGGPTGAIGDAAKRPGTPTVSTAATTPADALSRFEAIDAGDYFYTIQAVNRYGRSANVPLVAGPTAVAVAAGDKTTWAMTPAGVAPEWYEVFRTVKNGASGTERLILRVPNTAGAGPLTFNDYNNRLPGTTSAFMFQQNEEAMAVKQLAPLLRIPLATIDASIRWLQLLYIVPVLYTPGRAVLLRNVGRSAGYTG